ncbi:MAG: DNA repair exonuclease [Nitrospinota bacterium]
MAEFRFIHCSDLHIDSPFKGLTSQAPALARALRESTFNAFQNIARLALQEKVDAVLIAGDVFDGADRSLQAQLKFRRILKELSDQEIQSFIVHGNHDPLDSWAHTLEWPEHVTIFPGNKVQHVPVKKDGKNIAWIYGISYPEKEVSENLALKFRKEKEEGFSIGLLHANVGQHPGHDNYAPCSINDLVSRNFDYWALGHIHEHKVLRESEPAIVYSGNTQARHLNETGQKGCCLVTLATNSPPNIRFMTTDVVSYRSATLDLQNAETINDVIRSIQNQCEELAKETIPREGLVVRLNLTGRTIIHKELQAAGTLNALMEEIHGFFEGHSPWIIVELHAETAGTYDINTLKEGKDFIADLVNLCDETEKEELNKKIDESLKPVFESWAGRKYLEELSAEGLESLIQKSRNLALDQLVDNS